MVYVKKSASKINLLFASLLGLLALFFGKFIDVSSLNVEQNHAKLLSLFETSILHAHAETPTGGAGNGCSSGNAGCTAGSSTGGSSTGGSSTGCGCGTNGCAGASGSSTGDNGGGAGCL